MSKPPDRLLAFARSPLWPLPARRARPGAGGHARARLRSPPGATPAPRAGLPATPFARPATPFARPGLPAPTTLRPGLPFAQAHAGGRAEHPPPREIPLVEKKFDAAVGSEDQPGGRLALSINPAKWKHAETDNFIVHYRRATEAQKVVREVEYDLWYVATALKATKDRYAKKSHV